MADLAEALKLPRPGGKLYVDTIRLKYESFVVSSDYQLPMFDRLLTARMLLIARQLGIELLVMAGDTWNLDAFSKYGKPEPAATLEDELSVVQEVLVAIADTFKRTILLLGNHEWRLLKKVLRDELLLERFLVMCGGDPKTQMLTEYSWCEVNTSNGRYRITHPKNFSIITGRVPQFLGRKFTRDHIISAHGHRFGLIPMEDGKRFAIDSGGMFDAKRFAYKQTVDTTHAEWVSGFTLVLNGYPYLMGDLYADWDQWGRWLGVDLSKKAVQEALRG